MRKAPEGTEGASRRGWPLVAMIGVLTACVRVGEMRPDAVVTRASMSNDKTYVDRDAGVDPGVLIGAELLQALSTESSRVGDRFSLELLDPVRDGAGGVLLPRGEMLTGRVVEVRPSPFAGRPALLHLAVESAEGLPGRPSGGAVRLELAQAPLQLEGAWGQQVLGGLGGMAVGSGTGLLIDGDNAGAVLAAALVGAGVGALAASWLGPREASLPAGSIVTLRVVSTTAASVARTPCASDAIDRAAAP